MVRIIRIIIEDYQDGHTHLVLSTDYPPEVIREKLALYQKKFDEGVYDWEEFYDKLLSIGKNVNMEVYRVELF